MTLHFGVATAGCRARGVVRELIHRLKYDKDTSLRHVLGQWLVVAARDPRLVGVGFDALVPVPLHPAREREREFNQAVLLAETVSPLLEMPVRRVLRRVRFTETQTHFDRTKRMENLHDAFVPAKNAVVTNQNLLLVDDVFTTGSTVNECARVLRGAGARSVHVITVARG
jgi:ComF family protein